MQRNGFGITALVLGIISFVTVAGALIFSLSAGVAGPFVLLGFILTLGIPTALIGLAGLIFGIVGIVRGRTRQRPLGSAIWGVILSGLVVLGYVFLIVITSGFGAWAM